MEEILLILVFMNTLGFVVNLMILMQLRKIKYDDSLDKILSQSLDLNNRQFDQIDGLLDSLDKLINIIEDDENSK